MATAFCLVGVAVLFAVEVDASKTHFNSTLMEVLPGKAEIGIVSDNYGKAAVHNEGACSLLCIQTEGCGQATYFGTHMADGNCFLGGNGYLVSDATGTVSYSTKVCRDDIGYSFLIGDKCIKVNAAILTRTDARDQCTSEGGELLIMSNAMELNAIRTVLASFDPTSLNYYFIQGDDIGHDDIITDDAGNVMTYFDWVRGEPDAGRTDCLSLSWEDNEWKHDGWGLEYTYMSICQMTAL